MKSLNNKVYIGSVGKYKIFACLYRLEEVKYYSRAIQKALKKTLYARFQW